MHQKDKRYWNPSYTAVHSWLTCLFLLPLVPPILLRPIIQHGGLRCPSSLLLHSEKQLGIASSILYKSYINSLYLNTATTTRLVHSPNPKCTVFTLQWIWIIRIHSAQQAYMNFFFYIYLSMSLWLTLLPSLLSSGPVKQMAAST